MRSSEQPAGLPVQLGHLRQSHRWEEGDAASGTSVHGTDYYDLYAIGIPRPATGRTTAEIRCHTCGQQLRCTVYSARRTRWRQRRALLSGCAAIAGVAAAWSLVGLAFASDAGLGRNALAVTGAVFLGMATLAVLSWAYDPIAHHRADPGVKLHKAAPQHALRPSGASVHEWRHLGRPPQGW